MVVPQLITAQHKVVALVLRARGLARWA